LSTSSQAIHLEQFEEITMNARSLTLTAGLAILAVPFALSVTRAQSNQNLQVELFGGLTSSAAKLDANGNVLEASITLPMVMIENAPKTMNMTGPMRADAVLEFPEVVRKTTFLNHAGIFWNPMGHEPTGRYAAPHWDFHFFGIEPKQAAAIDCSDLTLENPASIAKGWLPPVPPNAPAKNFCVPLMGFHSEPLTEFKTPGQFKDGLFDKVMLGGYYAGQFRFIEPMVTTELLLKKQSFSLPVPVPSSLGKTTSFPTKFEAIFDAGTNAYRLVFSEFKPIN
jgi:hypothetical protein